jgi:predicted transcriptional regulator
MRRSNTKMILTACEMSFNGKTDNEIAAGLGASVSAVSRWRKTPMWIEFEQELISAHKESLLEAHRLTTLEDSTS